MRARLAAAVIAGLVMCSCLQVDAQNNRRSQLGTVSQVVGGTRVEIVYRRPVARGRELFGALVPWGRIWTPSADSAARLSVSAPVEVNGSRLAAGTYSLWAIPDSTRWTLIFSGDANVFHLRYTEGRDVLRINATPQKGGHVETLMFAFPVVDGDSAVMELQWGTTVVPVTIRAAAPPVGASDR